MNHNRTYTSKWNNPFVNTLCFWIGILADWLSIGLIVLQGIILTLAAILLFPLKLLKEQLDKIPRG
jgi:hypothetical protein